MLRQEIAVASRFLQAFCSQLTRQCATTPPVANPQTDDTDLNATRIYIDADACPVKDETYKVAERYKLMTFVVSNSFIQIPKSPLIQRMIVDAGPDIADDWIAEQVVGGDVVITNDIPLAGRVLAKSAHAIAPNGRAFTPDSIGAALAQRAIMEHIRSTGEITGGPPPFSNANRSQFLQALDQVITREQRTRR